MNMSLVYYIILESLLILSQLHPHSAQESLSQMDCVLSCGMLGDLYPPFTNTTDSTCAKFFINCTEYEAIVQFREKGKRYHVDFINLSTRTIQIRDQELEGHLLSNRCGLLNNFTDQAYLLNNFTQQHPPFFSININKTHPFFKCKRVLSSPLEYFRQFQMYSSCEDAYDLYYYDDGRSLPPLPADLPNVCSVVNLPSADPDTKGRKDNLTSFWSATFDIEWKLLPDCDICSTNGGLRSANANNGFECQTQKGSSIRKKLVIVTQTHITYGKTSTFSSETTTPQSHVSTKSVSVHHVETRFNNSEDKDTNNNVVGGYSWIQYQHSIPQFTGIFCANPQVSQVEYLKDGKDISVYEPLLSKDNHIGIGKNLDVLPTSTGTGKDVIVVIETENTSTETSQSVGVPTPDVLSAYGGQQVDRENVSDGWEILKSIVYGGLVESITSLSVVSSAAGSGAGTLNIIALGLANLFGGLFIIGHGAYWKPHNRAEDLKHGLQS